MNSVDISDKFIDFFGKDEYQVMAKTNTGKFSRWDMPEGEITMLSPKITNDLKVIPGKKYFVHEAWYVFSYVQMGERKYGIGWDPDLQPYFNWMQE
jgi:hypothetical protein